MTFSRSIGSLSVRIASSVARSARSVTLSIASLAPSETGKGCTTTAIAASCTASLTSWSADFSGIRSLARSGRVTVAGPPSQASAGGSTNSAALAISEGSVATNRSEAVARHPDLTRSRLTGIAERAATPAPGPDRIGESIDERERFVTRRDDDEHLGKALSVAGADPGSRGNEPPEDRGATLEVVWHPKEDSLLLERCNGRRPDRAALVSRGTRRSQRHPGVVERRRELHTPVTDAEGRSSRSWSTGGTCRAEARAESTSENPRSRSNWRAPCR